MTLSSLIPVHKIPPSWLGAATLALALLSAADAHAWHRSVNLRTAGGQFVVAEGGGGGDLNANRTVASIWETFTIVDHNAGQLMDGDRVSLRTLNGRFVVAEGNGGQIVRADRTEPGPWETFTIRKVSPGPAQPIGDGHQITLRTDRGYYLMATDGGGSTVEATRSSLGSWAIFTLGGVADPTPLRLSGPFTLAQLVGPTVFGVDRSPTASTNPAPICLNYQGEPLPHCYGGHQGTDFMFMAGFPGMNLGSINVVAAAPGRVVDVGDGNTDRCYGTIQPGVPPTTSIVCPGTSAILPNFVTVLQDDGLLAYYYHLKRASLTVAEGDRVACGQLLGKVGSAGDSTAPHLHFELRRVTAATIAAGGTLPGANASDFDLNAMRGTAATIDPYLPNLWAFLAGKIPAKTCTHPTSDATFNLGDRCGDLNTCGAGKACVDDVCKITNVPPGGTCDGNQVCGPGLACTGGTCTVPCTMRCPVFPHPNNCYVNAGNACVRDVWTTVRQDCPRVWGACVTPCFTDAGGNCKIDAPGTVPQGCALVCLP